MLHAHTIQIKKYRFPIHKTFKGNVSWKGEGGDKTIKKTKKYSSVNGNSHRLGNLIVGREGDKL